MIVSHWRTEDDARRWKAESEHLAAQHAGRTRWDVDHRVRIDTVHREYGPTPGRERPDRAGDTPYR